MSFYSFRDRPRLSDRIRGKSGDELIKELRKELDQDRKTFFETNPNWGPAGSTFPRAGHFDDSMMRGHMDLRSHLDDLAQRHPEFAEHLRWPPCSGDVRSNTWGRKRRGSGEDVGEASTKQQQQQQQPPQQQEHTNFEQENTEEPGPLRGRPKENLRNTVPDIGQKQQQQDGDEKEGRGQRSWSAPPDNRTQQPQDKPQRFVSKIEITPVNPAAPQDQQPSASSASPPNTGDAAKPPMPPKQPHQQQQQHSQPQHKQSTIRHIPIFVEGRDEPILPKVEQEFTQTQAPPPSYHHPQYTSHHQFQQQQAPPPPPPPPPQPQKQEPKPKPQPQKQEPKPQPQPKQQEPPVNPNDPISRVQNIQREVEELRAKIENFKGSRTDKEYIYLDEMLTRNLLKLDDIDTEGKENVRAARKKAIKSIQRCISVLEGKAPVQGKGNQGETTDNPVQQNTSDPVQSQTKDEKMDTTPVTTDTPASAPAQPPSEQQQNNENKMEIDNINKAQGDSKDAESERNTDKKQESENKESSNTESSKMDVESQPNNAAETQEKKEDSSTTAPAPSS